jgi:hypothetical protein
VDPDRWSVKLDTAAIDVASEGTALRASGKIAADLVLHRDALVLDGRIPMSLEYSLPRVATRSAEFDLPLLVAVTRRAPPAAEGPDELWSGAAFANILEDFTPRNATGSVFERPAIAIPAAEFRQVRIPLPVRLVVGATDPLRIAFPLAGNLLFGTLNGNGQAEVAWNRGAACITGRLKGSLNGLETDSVRAALQGMTVPVVRDVWDSNFALALDRLCLDRNRLEALAWDPASAGLIDRTSLKIHVSRVPYGGPGIFQMTAGADLKHVNQSLRNLVRNYRWQSMPEAIRYRQFDLHFETRGDRVVGRGPLLTLGGIEFTDGRIATGADLRVHLRPSRGGHASVRDLIELLRSFQ